MQMQDLQAWTKFLIYFIFCFFINDALAQSTLTSASLRQKLGEKVTDYNNNNFKVMRIEIGTIYKDVGLNTFRDLIAGKTYEVRAFSLANEIRDVDLRVYQEVMEGEDISWNIEIVDKSDYGEARVRFEPSASSRYKIVVEGRDFANESSGKYALIILTTD